MVGAWSVGIGGVNLVAATVALVVRGGHVGLGDGEGGGRRVCEGGGGRGP